jgi:hypothetical protein
VSTTAGHGRVAQGTDAAHWVIRVTGGGYAVGVLLLAVGVYVDLPGFLGAYGDPEAGWPIGVNVFLGLAAVVAWRYSTRHISQTPLAVALLGLGIVTVLVLAFASYNRCPDPGLSRGWSVVTRVVGLLTNNYAVDMFTGPNATCDYSGVPLALQFARLVQLAVVLVAATSALAALLGGQFDRLYVRFARRVSIAIGVDEDSVRLLPELARNTAGTARVILAHDPQAPWTGQARANGWVVLVGDASNARLLNRLMSRRGGRHALRDLYILSTPETVAFEQLQLVLLALTSLRSDEPIRVLLRSDNRWQAELLRQEGLATSATVVIDTVSRFGSAAQDVVADVIERRCDLVVLHGRSEMTMALLDELAQHSKERVLLAEGPTPRVVVTGATAKEVVAEHRAVTSRFGRSALDVEVDPREDLDALMDALQSSSATPALVLTGSPSEDDQRTASVIKSSRPQWQVYVPYAETAVRGVTPVPGGVRAYGLGLVAGAGSVGRWARLARLVHEQYVAAYPDPRDPARRPWSELSDFYRESNIRQVTSVIAGVGAVGRRFSTSSSDESAPSSQAIDVMARLEHESWFHFMRSHGWRWASTRDRLRRRHPALVPWSELPEDSREKTRQGVLETLELLASLGYRTVADLSEEWVLLFRRGEVTAVRRDEPWTWTTADGSLMHGDVGDWEVTDDDGATRSINDEVFRRSHEPIAGDRWRRVGEVHARRAFPGEVVHSLEGDQTARAGQWVLRGVAGEEWLVSSEHLGSTYDRVDADPSGTAPDPH